MDAYNGRILWERELPGVGRWPAMYRGGSMAADSDALYALDGRSCLRLDNDTGKTLLTYQPPPLPDEPDAGSGTKTGDADKLIWEYLAVTDDAVVGALGRPNIRRSWWSMAHPANRLLFVLDKATGKLRWTYRPQSAFDSNGIAIEGDQLFLIDGLAPVDVLRRDDKKQAFGIPGASHPRALVAVDMRSGKPLWKSKELGARHNWLYVAGGVILTTDPVWTWDIGKKEGPEFAAFSVEDGRRLRSAARLSQSVDGAIRLVGFL